MKLLHRYVFVWFLTGAFLTGGIVTYTGCSQFREQEVTLTPAEKGTISTLPTTEEKIAKLEELLGATVKEIKETNGKVTAVLNAPVTDAAIAAGSAAGTAILNSGGKINYGAIAMQAFTAILGVFRIRSDLKNRTQIREDDRDV